MYYLRQRNKKGLALCSALTLPGGTLFDILVSVSYRDTKKLKRCDSLILQISIFKKLHHTVNVCILWRETVRLISHVSCLEKPDRWKTLLPTAHLWLISKGPEVKYSAILVFKPNKDPTARVNFHSFILIYTRTGVHENIHNTGDNDVI